MLLASIILRNLSGPVFLIAAIFSIQKTAPAQTGPILPDTVIARINNDPVIKKPFSRYPPHSDTSVHQFKLRNEDACFGKILFRGTLIALGYNTLTTGLLLVVPESFSKWDRSEYGEQFRHSYTYPPVIDGDKWYINYIGHPYEGAFYYNSLRSQGARIWQSGLFCFAHSWLWEYLFEAGFEQPSVQDMVVTPVAGILLGELFHFSTVRMSRNGFKWYEKMFVCILDPTFAINNGFRYAGKPVKKQYLH